MNPFRQRTGNHGNTTYDLHYRSPPLACARGILLFSIREQKGRDALTPKQVDALSDDLLAFIEQHGAKQIAYRAYDVTVNGADVREGFRFASCCHIS